MSAVILMVISFVLSNAWPSKCSTDFSVSIKILSNATTPWLNFKRPVHSGSECGRRSESCSTARRWMSEARSRAEQDSAPR